MLAEMLTREHFLTQPIGTHSDTAANSFPYKRLTKPKPLTLMQAEVLTREHFLLNRS